MPLYTLLVGSYLDARSGASYEFNKDKTVIVPSDRELDKEFVGKFRLLELPNNIVNPPLAVVAQQPTPELAPIPLAKIVVPPTGDVPTEDNSMIEPSPDQRASAKPSLGEDMTEEWPAAVSHDLRVYRNAGRYWVYHESDMNTPIHQDTDSVRKGLAKRTQVDKYIEKWTEQHAAKPEPIQA